MLSLIFLPSFTPHLPQLRPHLGASNLKSSYSGPSYRRQTPAHDRTPSPPLEQRDDLPSGDPDGTGSSPFVFWSVAGAAVCAQQATAAAPREPGAGLRNSSEGITAPREPEDGKAEGTSAITTAATVTAAAATDACCCDTAGAPAPNSSSAPRQTGFRGGQAAGVDGAEHLKMSSPPIRWIWCCGAA